MTGTRHNLWTLLWIFGNHLYFHSRGVSPRRHCDDFISYVTPAGDFCVAAELPHSISEGFYY